MAKMSHYTSITQKCPLLLVAWMLVLLFHGGQECLAFTTTSSSSSSSIRTSRNTSSSSGSSPMMKPLRLLSPAAFSNQVPPNHKLPATTMMMTMETFPSSWSSLSSSLSTSLSSLASSAIVASSASSTADNNILMSSILTNENISMAFNIATFGPQILWVLMILLPNSSITKKVMGSYLPIIAFSLVHLFIVVASALQENGTAPLVEFNDVFDPSGNPQLAMIHMMTYPNFVSEEWSHVLTWDLWVGRMVWLDGLRRGIFTGHSVLFCNLIGPPGFLMHCATCVLTGKGIMGKDDVDFLSEKKED